MTERTNTEKLKAIDKDLRVRFWYGSDTYVHGETKEVRRTCNCLVKVKGTLYYGQSMCNPHDYFVKKTARDIAMGKAVKNYLKGVAYTLPVPKHIKMED